MRSSSWPEENGGGAPFPPATGAVHPAALEPAEAAPAGAEAASTARARIPRPKPSRAAALIQCAAALIWLPQAALIAWTIGGIASGAPASAALAPAAGVLALGLLRAALDAIGVRRAFADARAALTTLRRSAIAAVAQRSPLDINRAASGEAAAILGEQAEAVQPWLAKFLPARMKAVVVPLAILICVTPFSWVAAAILLMAAPLIPLFMALIGWRAQKTSEEQLVEMGAMNAFLLDRLRGLATIRTLGAVDSAATRLRANAEAVRRKTMAVLRIAFLSSAVLELFSALGVALVAVYVGFHLLGELPFGAWGDKLTLSKGLFILLLAPAFFEPLRELSAVWHDKAAGEAAMTGLDRLAGVGANTPPLTLPGSGATPAEHAPAARNRIAVSASDICFTYPGASAPALPAGFSLDIGAGERIALLGPSGSGKSTLLALLAGLAAPQRGEIIINDQTLDDASASALRQRMAWIGQQPHIFAGALAANVTLGRVATASVVSGHAMADTQAMAGSALAWANLDDLAARRGGAVIGENGVGISGGEALRLALARAAFNQQAGLVLADEPTAHLDRTTAHAITDGLLDLAEGRTLIVATHDPELASRMDRIIRLAPAHDAEARA